MNVSAKNLELNTLLKRSNLSISFTEFLKLVEKENTSLGKIISYQPIPEGYEDANIKIQTTSGEYVIKIFLKNRSQSNIESYVRVLTEANHLDVPVPILIKGRHGYINEIVNQEIKTIYITTNYFHGENFLYKEPSFIDMLSICRYLTKLNSLSFPISDIYDSWGNKNLDKEFKKTKDKLSPEQKSLISPIAEKIAEVDFKQFSKGVIHGDLQRNHVLKNDEGQYCILDFGCVSFDAKVIELSTFLAWFCLNQYNWNKKNGITQKIINEYTKVHKLSEYELQMVPILIKAAYASYYLKTSTLITEGDTSQETYSWHTAAKTMLSL